jgi:thioredoxin:protein disulfide reductase
VTDNTADDKALLKRHALFGPPGIVFFAPGQTTELRRVVGFQAAQPFAQVLDAVLGAQAGSLKVAVAANSTREAAQGQRP